MTRDELRALADDLQLNLYAPHKRAAAVLRQIADAQPYLVYDERTAETWPPNGVSETYRARLTPLYTLPLED